MTSKAEKYLFRATNVWCAHYFVIGCCGYMYRVNICLYMAHVSFYICYIDCMNVCCVVAVVEDSVCFSPEVLKYFACLCKGYDECCVSLCIVRRRAVCARVWEV